MDPYYPLPPPTLDELVQAATNALPSSHYLAAPSLSLNSLTMPSSSPSRPQTPLLPTPTHLRASTSLSASVGPTSNPRRNPNSNHPPRRRRTTPWELHILETAFAREPLPSQVQRQQIADSIGMTARACQVWFQVGHFTPAPSSLFYSTLCLDRTEGKRKNGIVKPVWCPSPRTLR